MNDSILKKVPFRGFRGEKQGDTEVGNFIFEL
jgi:hypothetical protein